MGKLSSYASKTTLVDADKIPLTDSAASNATKNVTAANLKAYAAKRTPNPVPMSSSSTLDLTGVDGNEIPVSGTTTIGNIVLEEGRPVDLLIEDGLTFAYDPTDLPILGKADLKALAGDVIRVVGGSGSVGYIEDIRPAAAQNIERVSYISGTTSPTPNIDTTDIVDIDVSLGTTTLGAPTGTPRDEQSLDIHFRCADVTPRPLAFNAIYRFVGCNAPTGISNTQFLRLQSRYNLSDNKWDVFDVRLNGDVAWETYTDESISAALADMSPDTRPVVAKTADYAVLAADHNKLFTNAGAGGMVKFTLPASAGCTAGKTRFTFFCTDAVPIQMDVDGSDHLLGFIDQAGNAFDVTSGSPVSSGGSAGESMSVLYIGGGNWAALSTNGRWS